MKVIFIGDKPSPRMKPGAAPFVGAKCEKRLRAWIHVLGVTHYEIYNQVDLVAVTPLCLFRKVGEKLEPLPRAKYIALGNNASKALKFVPHFKLPHPSGCNRQLNDKRFIVDQLINARKFLRGEKYD